MQTEIHHSCTAVPLNTVDTPQIASYRCCIALPCDVTCTVQIESHHCCNTVHWQVTFRASIANHQLCVPVMHTATWTLFFARGHCHIAMLYHSAHCKSPLLHCINFLQKWNVILIPAVSFLQSDLTASDVFNVGMYLYVYAEGV